jgi:predicted GNAT family N-acyltransferase
MSPRTPSLRLSIASTPQQIAQVMIVRGIVFIEEQGIPWREEMDGHDAEALHILGRVAGEPAAAGRLRFAGEWAKLERLAVRRAYRGRGFGRRLVDFMLREAHARGRERFRLHAQAHLEPYYRRLGFVPRGAPFQEAGIDHILMVQATEDDRDRR